MTNMLTQALSYAERGWHVLPLPSVKNGLCSCGNPSCPKPGKHPRTRGGVKDASAELSQIRRWWNQWPDANIGIRTGKESGLVVIDLDNKNGIDGEKNFNALAAPFGDLPRTLTARTGTGKHLFFRYPDTAVKNSVGTLANGVDVRADDGYVVAAPSVHANGKRYAWENPGESLADLPQWLLSRMTAGKEETKKMSNNVETHFTEAPAIPEGTRNITLYKLGCSLRGRLAMNDEEIRERLLLYNTAKCVPPLNEEEVLQIAESVCKHPPEGGNNKRSASRMERNPLYWFKLNVRDFSANQDIQRMTDYQLGWYMRLYVSAWQNGGTLPADDATLWRLAGAESREAFEKDSALVLSEYTKITIAGRERLINREMVAQHAEVLEQWLKVKAAGEASRERLRAMGPLQSMTQQMPPAFVQ